MKSPFYSKQEALSYIYIIPGGLGIYGFFEVPPQEGIIGFLNSEIIIYYLLGVGLIGAVIHFVLFVKEEQSERKKTAEEHANRSYSERKLIEEVRLSKFGYSLHAIGQITASTLCLAFLIGIIYSEDMIDSAIEYLGGGSQVSLHRSQAEFGKAYAIKIHEPLYSRELRAAGIEGYVITEHSVDEHGEVGDIEVKEEKPVGVFSEEAIKALEKSIYKPGRSNGKNIRTDKVLTKWSFTMGSGDQTLTCSNTKSEFGNKNCREID
jgi:hypothetical protein